MSTVMPAVSQRRSTTWNLGTVVALCVLGFFAGAVFYFVAWSHGYTTAQQAGGTVAVQMYVTAVDDGADVERYAVEQAGDQFTYQLSGDVMTAVQSTPNSHVCIDGLAITSIWTQYAERVTCDAPAIHVVLIAPY